MTEVPDGIYECWEKPCPNCKGTGKVQEVIKITGLFSDIKMSQCPVCRGMPGKIGLGKRIDDTTTKK